ncbi:MAG: chemotaxis protein CheW [Spirochaetota bacterium]
MNQKTKYLIFSIAEEHYAIPISKVQEVIQFLPITPLHNTNAYLKGVINLRGKIIPIIDMRLKFGIEEIQYNERTIFIITQISGISQTNSVGLAVDKVMEVVEIDESNIEKTPDIGFKSKNKYLFGIFQKDNKMIMSLNIDNILATSEIVEINQQIQS